MLVKILSWHKKQWCLSVTSARSVRASFAFWEHLVAMWFCSVTNIWTVTAHRVAILLFFWKIVFMQLMWCCSNGEYNKYTQIQTEGQAASPLRNYSSKLTIYQPCYEWFHVETFLFLSSTRGSIPGDPMNNWNNQRVKGKEKEVKYFEEEDNTGKHESNMILFCRPYKSNIISDFSYYCNQTDAPSYV